MKNFKSFIKQYELQEKMIARAAIVAALANTAQGHTEHTVKKGDTLSSLAQKHNTSVEDLAKLNKIENPNLITVGQVIKFPEKPKAQQPQPATPKPQPSVAAPVQQPKPAQTQQDCYGRLCSALQQAETGSFENKFIRTTHKPKGGSTAWGPGQITGYTARDMLARHPVFFSDKDYARGVISQSEKFAMFGAEPNKKGYDKKWDYGGAGDTTLHDNEKYNQMMGGVLRGMAKDIFGEVPENLTPEQTERLVTRYRGIPRSQDKRYFEEVDKMLKGK